MKRLNIIVSLVAIALSLTTAALTFSAGQFATLPNPAFTPGMADVRVTQEDLAKTICRPGYTATVRNVPATVKRKVFDEYGLNYAKDHGCCEVDHFVSLEIGGSNSILNLWPQHYCTAADPQPCYGAREKDVVETWLHRQVCAGRITLRQAQEAVRNWVEIYQGIKGDK